MEGHQRAAKSFIAAEYVNIKINRIPDFQMGVTNKTPEFLEMNPIGKVPVLVTPDGPIFESNAIARYVARLKGNNTLFRSSLINYAHIEQWIDFSSLEIDINIMRWYYPRIGFGVYHPLAEEATISGLKRGLSALNTHLSANTFLVGHCITLADIVMACNLHLVFFSLSNKRFYKIISSC